jgi:GTP-binding protein
MPVASGPRRGYDVTSARILALVRAPAPPVRDLMKARSARYVTSAADPSQFPPAPLPEVAIAGRSNVGKSSVINALCGHTGLARTSRTPGRTRLLNWFHVVPPRGGDVHMVDLPGYGYAEVPRSMRDAWRPLIEAFLEKRTELKVVVLLIDIRRGPADEELDFAAWLAERGTPVVVALTKADKVPKNKRRLIALDAKKLLALKREPVLVSAQDGDGLEDLWRAVMSHLEPA